jgi:hypothetical protein
MPFVRRGPQRARCRQHKSDGHYGFLFARQFAIWTFIKRFIIDGSMICPLSFVCREAKPMETQSTSCG